MPPTFRIHGYIGDGDNTAEAVRAFLAQHRGQAVNVIVNGLGGDAKEGGGPSWPGAVHRSRASQEVRLLS